MIPAWNMRDWTLRATALFKAYWLGTEHIEPASGAIRAMLDLGREMADERAEEIAKRCEFWKADAESITGTTSVAHISGLGVAAAIARSTISKPKTRERILEEALESIARLAESHDDFCICDGCRAQRALDWKP